AIPSGNCSSPRKTSDPEQLRIAVRVLRRIRGALGDGDVLRLPHKTAKLSCRHGMLIHPEPIHFNLADGPLLGIEAVVAHRERTTRDEDHPASAFMRTRS